jgi:two-component system response regulator DevR
MSTSDIVRIMIVDDHELVRVGLATILERSSRFTVVGQAATAEEAVELAFKLQPDVIIMDIRLPGRSGIEACRDIVSAYPAIRVIMLTSFADEQAVIGSVIAGAKGYVLKQIGSLALQEAIDKVMRGETLIDYDLLRKAMNRLQEDRQSPVETLNEREKQILALIGQAKMNKEIADELTLSEKTVRNYVSNILHKLNFSHRSQIAVYAVRKQDELK